MVPISWYTAMPVTEPQHPVLKPARPCSAGLYLLSECLRLGDRPVVIRGDGVGVTRLIWTANAASSGAAHDLELGIEPPGGA